MYLIIDYKFQGFFSNQGSSAAKYRCLGCSLIVLPWFLRHTTILTLLPPTTYPTNSPLKDLGSKIILKQYNQTKSLPAEQIVISFDECT